MTFGREADEAASFAIMDYSVEHGGTFLDTADACRVGEDPVYGTPAVKRTGSARQGRGAFDSSARRGYLVGKAVPT